MGFPQTEFQIDLDARSASFGKPCAACPLAWRRTSSRRGRTIHAGKHERQLASARQRQADPAWRASYTSTRPKVETAIAHLMLRKHAGRRAGVSGHTKVAGDFSLLSAAVGLARPGLLELAHQTGGWAISKGQAPVRSPENQPDAGHHRRQTQALRDDPGTRAQQKAAQRPPSSETNSGRAPALPPSQAVLHQPPNSTLVVVV